MKPSKKCVIIYRPLFEILTDQARLAYPEECCGLLFGRVKTEGYIVQWLLPIPNTEKDKHRQYVFDPLLFRDVELLSHTFHLRIIGIYHSHPNGTGAPSEKDKIMAWDDYLYCIVGYTPIHKPDIRFWQILDRTHISELSVEIVPLKNIHGGEP